MQCGCKVLRRRLEREAGLIMKGPGGLHREAKKGLSRNDFKNSFHIFKLIHVALENEARMGSEH